MLHINTLPLRLRADASRVVVRPFHLGWQATGLATSRAQRLLRNVLSLSETEKRHELDLVLKDFEARHWQTRRVFLSRFYEVMGQIDIEHVSLSESAKQLIGAYFCHEYSYAAAALMNPSVVPHPDQSGMSCGGKRIIISLRAVGEGHISSVAFREGIITPDGQLELLPEPPFATAADTADGEDVTADGPVAIYRHCDSTISGTVLFPMTPAQANGLEDLRLARFDHGNGDYEYIGTYTAYSGREIQSEILRTCDFRRFDLIPMTGTASRNKGMALFPRKIGGDFAMIGRQDGENLYLLRSDTLTNWNEGERLLEPRFPWEFIQIGNCGAPIELAEGWLLLTHGVGAMRKYAIGAVLLDKEDPSKVIGRTAHPILAAADDDREGYVPNVVYTCGAMPLGDQLFLPYGVADSAVAFALISIPELLACMA